MLDIDAVSVCVRLRVIAKAAGTLFLRQYLARCSGVIDSLSLTLQEAKIACSSLAT